MDIEGRAVKVVVFDRDVGDGPIMVLKDGAVAGSANIVTGVILCFENELHEPFRRPNPYVPAVITPHQHLALIC